MISGKTPPLLVFTGGHHTGALALALNLQKKGWRIFWIGHRHSQWNDKSDSAEYREVIQNGITFFDLKAGKIYHTFHPLKLLRLPLGFILAFYILLKLKFIYGHRLKGIVTFGGYLGVPVVFCGSILGLPVLAHEQTVVAGWANKFISVFAKKIAVTWPSGMQYYPQRKAVLTGMPFREEILQSYHRAGHQHHQSGLIYITGGKQGSHVINEAVFSVLAPLLTKHTVIHQTGSSSIYNDYQRAVDVRNSLPESLRSRYMVRDYLDPREAAAVLSTSELVIGRSGAHIIQELGLFKTRCVLIPIPWSSHNEQLRNAGILAENHQAVILPQAKLNGSSLLSAITAASRLQPGELNITEDGMKNMVQLIEQMFGKP